MAFPSKVAVLASILALAGTPIFALSGSGDSAAGSLDTVAPAVVSITALTGQSVGIQFSEAMLGAGASVAANYAASGAGRGTLGANPTSVTGGPSAFTLTWSSGGGANGQPLTITVSGTVQDALGNPLPINGTDNVASAAALPAVVSSFQID